VSTDYELDLLRGRDLLCFTHHAHKDLHPIAISVHLPRQRVCNVDEYNQSSRRRMRNCVYWWGYIQLYSCLRVLGFVS
jgi:hypothetical protein